MSKLSQRSTAVIWFLLVILSTIWRTDCQNDHGDESNRDSVAPPEANIVHRANGLDLCTSPLTSSHTNLSSNVIAVEAVMSTDSTDSRSESLQSYNSDYNQRVISIQRIAMTFYWYSLVIIYPLVGILGLAGNILSGIVITYSDLGKPSNIFLLGLAISDSFCLLGAINITQMLRLFSRTLYPVIFAWEYSRPSAYICFVFSITSLVISFFGMFVSASICTVITIERLLAVYLPLHFTSIVTPTRAWLVCSSAFLFWLPYVAYIGADWYSFVYIVKNQFNVSYGYTYTRYTETMIILDWYFSSILGKFLPLAIVTLGSVLIAIKVNITRLRRQKMVSSSSKTQASGSRTTVTLLMVCFIFSLTKVITLASYFIDVSNYYQSIVGEIIGIFIYLLEYTNSGCNFIIYVVFNARFREILKDLLLRNLRSK